MVSIYVASSWRNEAQPAVVERLRAEGFAVYDFRHPVQGDDGFAWSEIDPAWRDWTPETYREALTSKTAARGFTLDFEAMISADVCVLLLPSGRSAHIEAGWMKGAGKMLFILLDEHPEPELMYLVAGSPWTHIALDLDELVHRLKTETADLR